MKFKTWKGIIVTETRKLENFTKMGKSGYYDVECPFCGNRQLVSARNFHKGVRCKNGECRAKMSYCLKEAVREVRESKQ